MASSGLLERLQLPDAQCINDLDAPSATLRHGEIIQSKPFLRHLYRQWYQSISKRIASAVNQRTVIELGSGGGFIKDFIPDAITSDVLALPNVDQRFSATEMPFDDASIDAVVMIDVLHHIPDVRAYFRELERSLRPGGKSIMIEPANTRWGRFIYQNFHHEPFDPQSQWELPGSGPMTDANGAIPWIVFQRDRKEFQAEFPGLKINCFKPHSPLRYLLSGGVSMRQLVPSWTFKPITLFENLCSPIASLTGMFYTIELQRR